MNDYPDKPDNTSAFIKKVMLDFSTDWKGTFWETPKTGRIHRLKMKMKTKLEQIRMKIWGVG